MLINYQRNKKKNHEKCRNLAVQKFWKGMDSLLCLMRSWKLKEQWRSASTSTSFGLAENAQVVSDQIVESVSFAKTSQSSVDTILKNKSAFTKNVQIRLFEAVNIVPGTCNQRILQLFDFSQWNSFLKRVKIVNEGYLFYHFTKCK